MARHQLQQSLPLQSEGLLRRLDALHRDLEAQTMRAIEGDLEAEYAALAQCLRAGLERALPTREPVRRVHPVEAPDGVVSDADGDDLHRLFPGVRVCDVCLAGLGGE